MIAHDAPELELTSTTVADHTLPTIIEQFDSYARSFYLREEGLMNKRQVADYLSVSVRTVDNLVAEGKLHPLYVRAAKRFTRQSVERYVRSLERAAR